MTSSLISLTGKALPAPNVLIIRMPWADGRSVLSALKRWALCLFVLLGACTFYDQIMGDGRLPAFNEVGHLPEIHTLVHTNSTLDFPHTQAPARGWQALRQSRSLLSALSPEIAAWVYELRQNNRIVYNETPATLWLYSKPASTPMLAAYEGMSGKLYVGADFWHLSDGEKAAILAHEYRHARQNWPKQISVRLAQYLGGAQLSDQSRLEYEAFDYERQARAALGLSPLMAQHQP
ncbi:hypothetical protein [Vampirovibrio sp.]|uniref:hypothetical protein n=1 Tax=Vampirovibrio sp. TaxID=2717857 RepID=UPI00359482CB